MQSGSLQPSRWIQGALEFESHWNRENSKLPLKKKGVAELLHHLPGVDKCYQVFLSPQHWLQYTMTSLHTALSTRTCILVLSYVTHHIAQRAYAEALNPWPPSILLLIVVLLQTRQTSAFCLWIWSPKTAAASLTFDFHTKAPNPDTRDGSAETELDNNWGGRGVSQGACLKMAKGGPNHLVERRNHHEGEHIEKQVSAKGRWSKGSNDFPSTRCGDGTCLWGPRV